MVRLFNFKIICLILYSLFFIGCDPCGTDFVPQGQYGLERDEFEFQYNSPAGVQDNFKSYFFVEKGIRKELPVGSSFASIDFYPFIPVNTFILYGPSDTDTIQISNLDYSLVDQGKCGAEVQATPAEIATSFDSSQIIYSAPSNRYSITIYRP